jgi:hypothetical protein
MSKILEIDITLKGSKPKIWRRILIPGEMSFADLHYAIQTAMGWYNCHLHQFVVGRNGRLISIPYGDDLVDMDEMDDVEDGHEIKIKSLLNAPKDKVIYEYDFGDGWEHLVEVKKVHDAEPGKTYPQAIAGAMACPPEDCGGIWGYKDMLEKLQEKGTAEYEELVEWLGSDFDPTEFDLEQINMRFLSFGKE